MTPTEITAYLTALAGILGGVFVPIYMKRRDLGRQAERTSVASWQGITNTLQEERDSLRTRLDRIDQDYANRLRVMEDNWQGQIHKLEAVVADQQKQITEQQAEIGRLYARLGRQA